MSAVRTPLLVIGGGCAAMLAAAVATVAMGSFYAEMPVEEAHAAQLDLPAKKVRTIKLTAEAAAPPAKSELAAMQVSVAAAPAKPRVAVKPAKVAARLNSTMNHPVTQADVAAKLESAFAAQGAAGQSAAVRATEAGLGRSDRTFASLAQGQDAAGAEVAVPTQVALVPSPAPRAAAKAQDDDDDAVSGRAITIRVGVNMRSAAKSGSRVIQVIPSGARVILAPGCQHWCKVSYNGRAGYIYKSFVTGVGAAAKPRTRKAPAVAQAAPRKPEPAAEKPEPAGLFGNGGVFGKPKTANSDTNDN